MVDVDGLYEVIRRTLEIGYGSTRFVKVYGYEPMGVTPGPGPFAAFWYTGESETQETMGNVMVTHTFDMALLWPMPADQSGREAIDRALMKATRDIKTAFRANSQLDGYASDMKLGDANLGYGQFGNADYRAQRWTIFVMNLEEESIVA